MRTLISHAARVAREIDTANAPHEVWRELKAFVGLFGFERMLVLHRTPAGVVASLCPDITLGAHGDYGLSKGFADAMPFSIQASGIAAASNERGWIVPLTSESGARGVLVVSGADPDLSPLACSVIHLLSLLAFCKGELAAVPAPQTKGRLTGREIECLRLVARGKTDREIAQILSVSPRTARFHVENVKTKLRVDTRVQAVAEAIRRQLIAA
jgi:DNA-binding CsgD family transcriptional regulator